MVNQPPLDSDARDYATELDMGDQGRMRLAKLEEIRGLGLDPYPPRSHRTMTTCEAIEAFEQWEAQQTTDDGPQTATGSELRATSDNNTARCPHPVAAPPSAVLSPQSSPRAVLTGRLRLRRTGGKVTFAHIEDESGRVQLYFRINDLTEPPWDYEAVNHLLDLGDFIQAEGYMFRTRTGEPTLHVERYHLISKALHPLPEKYHGLQDVETRYRQRYLDLIANEESREVFRVRSRMITYIRRFLDSRGFLEVETPTLQPIYGGAAARPFTTHHNALDQTLYLRIADELYLKRLIVGGFERVYEICKDFRNEGVDTRHNPEFTQLEFYMAYADYNDVMDLSEQMLSTVTREALGTATISWEGHEIDLNPPWRRLSMAEAIFEATGIDYEKVRDQQELYRLAKDAGADVAPTTVWPRLVDELMKTFVRPKLIQPTFLIDYPVELSPLAKRSPEQAGTVERFQVMIGGVELCNAYSELNDPMDQLDRFMEQARDR